MKRADDFREFIKDIRLPDESFSRFPDLPFGCDLDFLDRVYEELPIADNPFEKSSIREDGLKIWDSVFIPTPRKISVDPKNSKDIAPVRSINSGWLKTKDTLNMVGRPDGVHYIRPKGTDILDLMNDDIRLLQGAHILTHRTLDYLPDDEYTFGITSELFLRNLIKIFLAKRFGLLIKVDPESKSDDTFSKYGIEVFGTTSLRNPVLQAAIDGRTSRLFPDHTVICILGSVGIEPHPKNLDEDVWRENDKWACLPMTVALAGWECIDYISHSDIVELRGDRYYSVPCDDLQDMDSFADILSCAEDTLGKIETSDSVMKVDEWIGSDDFRKALDMTPQLPCPHCIRFNTTADGLVRKPRSKKPRKSLKEISGTNIPELKEWVEYVDFVQKCVVRGRKATAYSVGSITSVERRNRNFKKRQELLRRISSLSEKYIRKASNGFISESEVIKTEIDKLKMELTS